MAMSTFHTFCQNYRHIPHLPIPQALLYKNVTFTAVAVTQGTLYPKMPGEPLQVHQEK